MVPWYLGSKSVTKASLCDLNAVGTTMPLDSYSVPNALCSCSVRHGPSRGHFMIALRSMGIPLSDWEPLGIDSAVLRVVLRCCW